MTNNAAALERLEAMESQMREWITAEVEPDLDRIEQWANDLATLRATLAQPDALTSQPSGVAVAWISEAQLASLHAWPQMSRTLRQARLRATKCGDSTIPLYTHPSADAPGVAVDEIAGAVARGWCSPENSHKEMDHALAHAITLEVCAALAPKPEGGHG